MFVTVILAPFQGQLNERLNPEVDGPTFFVLLYHELNMQPKANFKVLCGVAVWFSHRGSKDTIQGP